MGEWRPVDRTTSDLDHPDERLLSAVYTNTPENRRLVADQARVCVKVNDCDECRAWLRRNPDA